MTRSRLQGLSSFLVSLVVHAALLTIAAMVMYGQDDGAKPLVVFVGPVSDDPDQPTLLDTPSPDPTLAAGDAPREADLTQQAQSPNAPNVPSPVAAPAVLELPTLPIDVTTSVPAESLLIESQRPTGGGFEGRSQEQRARLVGERGGTPASESAVELGLAWLAMHQRKDGGWQFGLASESSQGPCCRDPGMVATTTGATGLALLPFLGAGYTHEQGPYRKAVEDGLYYLTGRMIETPHGGDLQEGTMYAQGIAALALCEGYAMSGDENLKPYAQKAVDFICAAQHPQGGWRYMPGEPGDTTVTGWQLMALKSASMSRLYVPSPVTEKVTEFLDSVQERDGALYGYQKGVKTPGATAVGLLSRMYLGWGRDDPRLDRGVAYLANLGPSRTDMYFNYYATQVLHHQNGNRWPGWNTRMRDFLIDTQARSGHEKGSWFFPDRHGTLGGRLYTTAMCIMILEVYYRYMPLYGSRAVEENF